MTKWFNFCSVVKINNKKKSLVADLATRFFLNDVNLSNLKSCEICLVPPELDIPRKYKILDVSKSGNRNIELMIENIESIDDLSIFKNKAFLISEDFIKEAFGDSVFDAEKDLIGYSVCDVTIGELGNVKDIQEMPSQSLLIVDYKDKEIMIPYVDGIVLKNDGKSITVDLPEGLVELN